MATALKSVKPASSKAPAAPKEKAPAAEAPTKTKAELAAEAKAAKEAEAAKAQKKAERDAERATKTAAAQAARDERTKANDAMKTRVATMRAEGQKWPEIASELGISLGKAQLLGAVADGEAAGVKTATPALVRRDRDELKMGWVAIAVQYGLSKAATQKLYKEAGGDPHASYVGKGGRYFSHEDSIASARAEFASQVKPKSEKAPRATKEAKPLFTDESESDEIKSKIDGKTISIITSGKVLQEFEIKAGTVKIGKQKNGVRVVQFSNRKNGGGHTVRVDAIVKVTK